MVFGAAPHTQNAKRNADPIEARRRGLVPSDGLRLMRLCLEERIERESAVDVRTENDARASPSPQERTS